MQENQNEEALINEAMALVDKGIEEASQNKELKESEPETKDEINDEIDELAKQVDEESEKEEEEPRPVEKKDKILRDKKNYYKTRRALDEVTQENLWLKSQLNEALNSGAYHYQDSAQSKLENLKQLKKLAIEEGDSEKVIDIDIEITKTVNSIEEIKRIAANTNQQEEIKPQYQQHQTEQQYIAYLANDWIEDYPELKQGSRTYNPKLVERVGKFAQALEERFQQRGELLEAYDSGEIFDHLDRYIEKVKSKQQQISRQAETANYVSNVKNVYNKPSSTPTITLTADQKSFCAASDISEKDYIKELMKLNRR